MNREPFPTRAVLSLAALALVFTAGILAAGPLNPPPGAVTSTYKTLSEVEPRIAINAANTPGDAASLFKITQPGSYYLTGNIQGVAGKSGILITSDRVTIDLGGFSLVGAAGSVWGINTPNSPVTYSNISIRNGTITGWQIGVFILLGADDAGTLIDSVIASDNTVDGFRLNTACVLRGCIARANGQSGFNLSAGSTSTSCSASRNGFAGFVSFDACSFTACSAYDNGSNGFEVGNGCSFSTCAADRNNSRGFSAATGATFQGCSAQTNGFGGFLASFGAALSSCAAASNGGDGIWLTARSATVISCTAISNSDSGINAQDGCLIAGCSLNANGLHNILAGSNNTIRDNTCANFRADVSNGAGIYITGNDNRIEGNHSAKNQNGYLCTGTGNFFARNTAAGNTVNWGVVSANVCFVLSATTSGAVTGDSGGVSPGSTSPYANFTH